MASEKPSAACMDILWTRRGRSEMKSWPFSKAEWATVSNAALPVVNSGLADDTAARASHLVGLRDVLAQLRARHGDHPVLLETEAEFTEDDGERVSLYRRAVGIAEANGIQTLTIRLSLSRLLLDMGQPDAAHHELLACEGELANGDQSDRASWAELVAETRHPVHATSNHDCEQE